jgi:hypothetical protein
MSASQLDKFKVNHLFLLVGENPLPNYIAARTLLKDHGTVYLVFTNQTKKQKNSLLRREGLRQYNIKCKEIDLANYESNPYYIRDRIQKQIKSLPPGIIGLNYTGGTKPMAVHAYKAIEESAQEINGDVVFSYLDPRNLKTCIDQPNDKPREFDVPLQLSLKEIFNLHDNKWREDKQPQSKPVLEDAAAKFAEFYQNNAFAEEWKNWCKNQLRPFTKTNGKWKEEAELKNIKPISLKDLSDKIKAILRENLDASTNEISLNVTKTKGFDSLQQICEWLDGTWLESYVLAKVQEIQGKFGIKESMMSFHIKDSQNRDRFEFDVAFIKGYQLFAISCTTSMNKKLCKEKLFEAHLRARQLGGDEARVALVCFFDRPEWIKDDMRFAIDDRKIEVFGIDDIENIAHGIADWIERNNREANA